MWVNLLCLKFVDVLRAQSDFTTIHLVPVGRATIQQNRVNKGTEYIKRDWVKKVGTWLKNGVDVFHCKEDLNQLHEVVNAKGSCGCVGKVPSLFWGGLGRKLRLTQCSTCKQQAKPTSEAQRRKFFVCK